MPARRKTRRIRPTTAAVTLAVLALLGAEDTGCQSQNADRTRVDAEPNPVCFQTAYIVRPPAGLGGDLEYHCTKPPLRHTVTIALERSTGSGWTELDRATDRVAPAADTKKTLNVRAACQAGTYKVWHATDIEFASGRIVEKGPVEQQFVITEENCR